jgi:hypothetical protein
VTNGPADKIAKRALLWASAFAAVVFAGGIVTKWLVADPMGRASAKIMVAVEKVDQKLDREVATRQATDSLTVLNFEALKIGQAGIVAGLLGATYTKEQIDGMRAEANVVHGDHEKRLARIERRLGIRGAP